MPILANLVNRLLLLPAAVLLLPIAVTLWIRWTVLRADEAKQRLIWAGYRSFGRFILAVTVAAWWVIWDFRFGGPSADEILRAAILSVEEDLGEICGQPCKALFRSQVFRETLYRLMPTQDSL